MHPVPTARFNARMELPAGLTAAPYTSADLDAVFAVAAAQQQHDIGRVDVERADFEADWQRPSFDFGRMTTGVYDGAQLVAFAELIGAGRGEAGVLPAYRRRGIGTALARWLEEAAREHGYPTIGGPVPQGSDGDRLLEKLGYPVRWTSWVLQVPEGATIPHREVPAGYAIRAATPDDHQAVWTVVEDAFLEWSERDREPFDDFIAAIVRRPGHQPWMLRVVTDPAGDVVGTAALVMAEDGATGDHGGIRRAARRPEGPARPGPRPGAARRRLRAGPAARRPALRPLHRLPDGRARALREGRHGRHRRLGEPGDLARRLAVRLDRRSFSSAGDRASRGGSSRAPSTPPGR